MTTLTTDRLILRHPLASDLDAYEKFWSDPAMLDRIPIEPQTRAQCWDRLVKMAGGWALCGYGNWLAFDKLNDRLIGQFGFFKASRGFGPAFDNHIEAGWIVIPEYSGKGLTTEGMQAVLGWLDQQDFGDRTVCEMSSSHSASIRVAEKCGYKAFGNAEDELGSVQLMVRFKP